MARKERDEAFQYYLSRSTRAAYDFRYELDVIETIIIRSPFLGLRLENTAVHSLKLHKYPYRVYYEVISETEISVLLLFNLYQNPKKLTKLLKRL